jgi:signal transduction histidine kinase
VAFAGVVPLAVLGGASLELLRARVAAARGAAFDAVAAQVAGRVEAYVGGAEAEIREIAAGVARAPDGHEARRRIEEAPLDAPALSDLELVDLEAPGDRLEERARASLRHGWEVASGLELGEDGIPHLERCVPLPGRSDRALCAHVDLLELSRFVQRLRFGDSGRALVLDADGRVVASGAGAYRAAVLTGEDVPHSGPARRMAAGEPAGPRLVVDGGGERFLAGWARAASPPWTVVVQQPERDALRTSRLARNELAAVLALALAISVAVGVVASRRVLADLARDERWRTAGRIASGVSHDLGHRVAVLHHAADLAAQGDPSALPRLADDLRAEADTLRRFVADFADLSRDLAVIDRRPVDLAALARSLAVSGTARAAALGVAVEAGAGDGAWVEGDRHLLERAGMNLVANAVEASPRGATVRLSVAREGGECVLRVADSGPGIPAARLRNLFDAFASTKRSGDHLGMGLPNVKRIVEAHGGRVAASNAPAGGAVLEIRLPGAEPPA